MASATTDLARLTQGGPSKAKRAVLQAGRQPKLTAEVSKKICDAVRAGNYISVAARYAGVQPGTLWLWKSKAEKATTRNGRDKLYVDFVEDLDAAEAFAEVSANLHWRAAMPKDWHASEKWLATRYPERYAPQRDALSQTAVQVNVTGGPQTVHDVQMQTTSIAQLLEANPSLIGNAMSVLDQLLPAATSEVHEGDWREVPDIAQDTPDQLPLHEGSSAEDWEE